MEAVGPRLTGRLKIVNTVPQSVEWEQWQVHLGESPQCEDDLSPRS